MEKELSMLKKLKYMKSFLNKIFNEFNIESLSIVNGT